MPSAQEAFRRQAMSDLRAYQVLVGLDLSACHSLHFLQMATEKLGKALRRAAGQSGADAMSHAAIVKALRVLRNRRQAGAVLHCDRFEQWQAIVDGLLPPVDSIERLAPSLAGNAENPEYPWERGNLTGEWVVPSEHDFAVVRRVRSPEGARLIDLLLRIGGRFDELFK